MMEAVITFLILFGIVEIVIIAFLIPHLNEHDEKLLAEMKDAISHEVGYRMLDKIIENADNIDRQLKNIMTEKWLDEFIERINKKQIGSK